MEIEQWLDNNQLSIDIWHQKYQHDDESFDEWLDRVSGGNQDIRQLILDKKFLFGGRILANRGLNKEGRKITLSNCYVIAPPDDNLESIFECASKLARTYSYGGGCGVDVSKLRPKGSKVNNAAKTTSGATSFMDFFSYVTGLIGQEGRRGALMLSIDCTHPDLEEFINLKSDPDKCTKANISVRVSDDFMRAVESDSNWLLSFNTETEGIIKSVKAKEIFNLLAKRNWESAEPGILYWDHICKHNMLDKDLNFSYAGTNPCAEEPLPAGGSCLLGSINLAEFVVNPFTTRAYIDFNQLEYTVAKSIQALNQVLLEGMPLHPLKEQQDSVYNWRQIGLGIMGLGDMLIKLGVKYGSVESLKVIKNVMHEVACNSVETSLQLAKTEGCYPMCNKEALANSTFINSIGLSKAVIDEIREYGLFNSQLLTCAPTGSIGTMLQISTGVEPNFMFEYNRRTQSLYGEDVTYKIYADIVNKYKEVTKSEDVLPDYFVTSQSINPIDRIKVQAMLQNYIDASISSTINLPEETTVEEVADIYYQAWKYGLKGVTIYRDNCQRQGILTTNDEAEATNSVHIENEDKLNSIEAKSRDTFGQALVGKTYKYKTACGTLYITINKDSEGNIVEIFTNSSKNGTCKANLNGETRLASLALRSGVKVSEVIDSLKSIQCQSCAYARAKGNKIDGASCPDIIAKCIKEEYNNNLSVVVPNLIDKQEKEQINIQNTFNSDLCPECGKPLIHTGGCVQCECGYSRCG